MIALSKEQQALAAIGGVGLLAFLLSRGSGSGTTAAGMKSIGMTARGMGFIVSGQTQTQPGASSTLQAGTGSQVTFTATPAQSTDSRTKFQFDHWVVQVGSASPTTSTTNPLSITVTDSTQITAVFIAVATTSSCSNAGPANAEAFGAQIGNANAPIYHDSCVASGQWSSIGAGGAASFDGWAYGDAVQVPGQSAQDCRWGWVAGWGWIPFAYIIGGPASKPSPCHTSTVTMTTQGPPGTYSSGHAGSVQAQ
jgi:hypothetical protein